MHSDPDPTPTPTTYAGLHNALATSLETTGLNRLCIALAHWAHGPAGPESDGTYRYSRKEFTSEDYPTIRVVWCPRPLKARVNGRRCSSYFYRLEAKRPSALGRPESFQWLPISLHYRTIHALLEDLDGTLGEELRFLDRATRRVR